LGLQGDVGGGVIRRWIRWCNWIGKKWRGIWGSFPRDSDSDRRGRRRQRVKAHYILFEQKSPLGQWCSQKVHASSSSSKAIYFLKKKVAKAISSLKKTN